MTSKNLARMSSLVTSPVAEVEVVGGLSVWTYKEVEALFHSLCQISVPTGEWSAVKGVYTR